MNLIAKLKIGTRLALGFGLMLLFMAGVALTGGIGAAIVKSGLVDIYQNKTVPLGQMAEINQLIVRNRLLMVEMVNDINSVNFRIPEVEDNILRAEELWKSYKALPHEGDERKQVVEFEDLYNKYVNDALRPGMELLRSYNQEEGKNFYNTVVVPFGEDVIGAADQLGNTTKESAAKQFDHSTKAANLVQMVVAGVAVVAVVLGILCSFFITRSIVMPIRKAVDVANTVAAGDLTSVIAQGGSDETGQLLHALHVMNDSLVRVVSEVRQGSDSIATGSTEIARGNSDLSQRTEAQASNLEETAASMEELTATVKQNTETSRQASQLAQVAREAAFKGGEVVGEVVKTMNDITGSSRKIADIIGVIDGIAFQTNILALNAAVEAARAGEQGRGFAVVAGEVRTLAQRSAQAAKEIKVLIEASVSSVDAGSRLVGRAGQSMDNIVTQVQRVTDLISEITAASEEQSNGIAQVGSAVAQLDQVTQQNAALVEQSAAAAESLRTQAANLTEVVSAFKLSGGSGGGYRPTYDAQMALESPEDEGYNTLRLEAAA
ncbi:MAG TPA: methyl-accepting chemotaxis protein [Macromonas sp.]|nr:methyl-accepting chemotaxis protein [Macromonas sp.]